jgi:hypothetical protein
LELKKKYGSEDKRRKGRVGDEETRRKSWKIRRSRGKKMKRMQKNKSNGEAVKEWTETGR